MAEARSASKLAVALVAGLLLPAAAAAAPATAAADWGRPFRLAAPRSSEITPARVAFSAAGDAAVAFGVQDEDDPALEQSFVTQRSPRGALSGPRRVPDAQETLALAFEGSALDLLTAASPAGEVCCSSAAAVQLAGGSFGRPRTVVRGLTGAALGALTSPASNRLLAAIATGRGVWVAQSPSGDQFAPARALGAAGTMPWALASTTLGGGRTLVAWTASNGQPGGPGPDQVLVARGSQFSPPSGAAAAVTLVPGHELEELGLAPGGTGGTAAWVEGWIDPSGAYQSEAAVSDLGAGARQRHFPIAGQLASGLAFAGDQRGVQVIAWKSCTATGSCSVWAAVRRPRTRFAAAVRLGAIDGSQAPAVAVSPRGQALVGWISGGDVFVARPLTAAGQISAARRVSAPGSASDLTIALGDSGSEALAVWTQGIAASEVVGAVDRGL